MGWQDDYNWIEAFKYADGFGIGDVSKVLGSAEGENDGPEWVMYGQLSDGRYFTLRAGCDYTGWDCQAGGSSTTHTDLQSAIKFGLTNSERERLGVKEDGQ